MARRVEVDLADGFDPRDPGEGTAVCHALPEVQFRAVQPEGTHSDAHLSGCGFGHGDVTQLQHLGPARCIDDDRAHRAGHRTAVAVRASSRVRSAETTSGTEVRAVRT